MKSEHFTKPGTYWTERWVKKIAELLGSNLALVVLSQCNCRHTEQLGTPLAWDIPNYIRNDIVLSKLCFPLSCSVSRKQSYQGRDCFSLVLSMAPSLGSCPCTDLSRESGEAQLSGRAPGKKKSSQLSPSCTQAEALEQGTSHPEQAGSSPACKRVPNLPVWDHS